jgi:hypothetical protein
MMPCQVCNDGGWVNTFIWPDSELIESMDLKTGGKLTGVDRCPACLIVGRKEPVSPSVSGMVHDGWVLLAQKAVSVNVNH